MGLLLKVLVEKLQVTLGLLAEVPVALDLAEVPVALDLVAVPVVTQAMGHPVVTQAMDHPVVTQEIAVLEAIALTVETRVMTDHPAMETVGLSVMGTAEVMAEAMVVAMAEVMVVAMAEVMVVATAEVMVETSRPDDLVFKKLYGSP